MSPPHLVPSKMKKLLEIYRCTLDDLIEAFESPRVEVSEPSAVVVAKGVGRG